MDYGTVLHGRCRYSVAMKIRFATIASLAGVLAAGSAAAAVNAQVLSIPEGSRPRVESVASSSTSTSIAASTAPKSSGAPGSTSAPAGARADYRLGDGGVLTVETDGVSMRIAGLSTTPGWTLVEQEQNGRKIEITLASLTTRIEFDAALVVGVVSTSLDVESIVVTTVPTSGAPATTTAPSATSSASTRPASSTAPSTASATAPSSRPGSSGTSSPTSATTRDDDRDDDRGDDGRGRGRGGDKGRDDQGDDRDDDDQDDD
jgi:hypothetical protein